MIPVHGEDRPWRRETAPADVGTSFPSALPVADGSCSDPNLTQLSASLCRAQIWNNNTGKLHQFTSTLHYITPPIKRNTCNTKKEPVTGLPTAPVWDESVNTLVLIWNSTRLYSLLQFFSSSETWKNSTSDVNLKMAGCLLVVAPCNLVDFRRFRNVCCLHHHSDGGSTHLSDHTPPKRR